MTAANRLQHALAALKQQRYAEAVTILEDLCQDANQLPSSEHKQAQMALVKAYQRAGQLEAAIALCEDLTLNGDLQVQSWAQQALPSLKRERNQAATPPSDAVDTSAPNEGIDPQSAPKSMPKAGRAMAGIIPQLAMKGVAGSLALASGVTITLLLGMVLALAMGMFWILQGPDPVTGFAVSVGVTVVFNTVVFFVAPWIMDLVQQWLYGTRWVSLAEVQRQSPETAQVIQRVCAQKQIRQPRLGIIDDQNPTAFTYGSLPNSARLVVSQGLFTYLDDDEVATVYAHELGHIVHWDFAVMTLASTLVQLMYLLYTFARRMGRRGNNKSKDAFQTAALVAYLFYLVGTYLVLYLSRTREYYADHFAAETTGNPNGLSRALVKIAYGIVEEAQHAEEPSRLVEGTRALGIYDAKAATSTGTAYRITSTPEKIGRIFLWDMFNPWAWWMELNSTHPLTGKRVRALSTYAEQLGLPTEFDMGRVMGEGKRLNKRKLYRGFALDVLLYCSPGIGFGLGLLLGIGTLAIGDAPVGMGVITPALVGFGVGTLLRMVVMFPDVHRPRTTDVLTLMSDPYASPLRGQPVQLSGDLIGRGDAGSKVGSDLKLQDPTGLMYLRYSSRFGSLGNFLFGLSQVRDLIGNSVSATGWFRRGIAPWVDLTQLQTDMGQSVSSYHRFWTLILGVGSIILGIVLPFLF